MYLVGTHICRGQHLCIVGYMLLGSEWTSYLVGTSDILWETFYLLGIKYLVGTQICRGQPVYIVGIYLVGNMYPQHILWCTQDIHTTYTVDISHNIYPQHIRWFPQYIHTIYNVTPTIYTLIIGLFLGDSNGMGNKYPQHII